jgi:hypothetical protein
MSKRPSSRLSFGSASCGGSPTTRSTRTSSSVAPSGTSSAGRIRDSQPDVVALLLRQGEVTLGSLQLLLDAAQLLELLRRRLALELRARAELVDRRHERAPVLVDREPRVEGLCDALAREAAPELVRLGAGGAGVDHARESR